MALLAVKDTVKVWWTNPIGDSKDDLDWMGDYDLGFPYCSNM